MSWRTARKRATASSRRRTTTIRGSFTPCRTRRWWCMHRGNVALLGQMHNLPVLAVVGTRNASEYGSRVAENMSHDLAQAGFIIVSGLALGIDSYAHSGALRAGKRTVAVLGSGLDTDYPPQSAPMRKQILATAAWCSPNWSRPFRCGERTFPPATACWQD